MKNGTDTTTREILPMRRDGELVPSSEFALLLAWHVQPWEEVVEAYRAAREEELRPATASA